MEEIVSESLKFLKEPSLKIWLNLKKMLSYDNSAEYSKSVAEN